MLKLISIDPGKFKCGLVLAEISEKKVYKAIILKTELISDYVRNLNSVEDISKIIIGNGTNSREIREYTKEKLKKKYLMEVVSLKDSKTAEAIIVELNVTGL